MQNARLRNGVLLLILVLSCCCAHAVYAANAALACYRVEGSTGHFLCSETLADVAAGALVYISVFSIPHTSAVCFCDGSQSLIETAS